MTQSPRYARDIAAARERAARRGLYVSAGALLMLSLAWLASGITTLHVGVPALGFMIEFDRGELSLLVNGQHPGGPGFTVPYSPYRARHCIDIGDWHLRHVHPRWLAPRLWRREVYAGSPVGTGFGYHVAIWLVLLPCAISLLYFWIALRHRKRRTARMEHECIACGYNLYGNVSGVCPECQTVFRDTHEVIT